MYSRRRSLNFPRPTRPTAIKAVIMMKLLFNPVMDFHDNRFRSKQRRLQCVNWLHASLSVSHSLTHSLHSLSHSLCHTLSLPLALSLSLDLSLAHWSVCSRLSFHSRENFPHPSSFGEKKTRQNVIIYVIWILQHFTCPGFNGAAVFVTRKFNGRRRRMRIVGSWGPEGVMRIYQVRSMNNLLGRKSRFGINLRLVSSATC